ncbi:MAG: hypothetical protein SNG90_03005 [Rikenellaceae bacterium]
MGCKVAIQLNIDMARLKSQSIRYVTITESEYLRLIENTMVIEAMRIAGVESLPIYNAVQSILQDGRVQVHTKPLCKRYSYNQNR